MTEDLAAIWSHVACGPLSCSEILWRIIFANDLMGTLITRWHGAHDIRRNR